MERLKTALTNYYQMLKQAEEVEEKIKQIQYTMDGVGGISYDTVKAGTEDRGSKIIRLMDAKEPYEEVLDHLYIAMALLRTELHLDTLTEDEEALLRYALKDRLTYDTIAERLHYSGKVVIHRKLKAIYKKLEGKE